jgi:hypothetical protein
VSPVVTTNVTAGATSITGYATSSVTNGVTVNVAIVQDVELGRHQTGDGCAYADNLGELSRKFLPLTDSSGTAVKYVPTNATSGTFTLTLVNPMVDGQRFHLVQILPPGTELSPQQRDHCDVSVLQVNEVLDWGRIHADFTAGVLISNDSGNSVAGGSTAGAGDFSQAHQFYALTVEKAWLLPGCYLLEAKHSSTGRPLCGDKVFGRAEERARDGRRGGPRRRHEADAIGNDEPEQASRWRFLSPGVFTYFDARLTAIPISDVSTNSSTATTTTALTSAQTARVDVGVLFPFFAERWTYQGRPNALYIAPLVKVGFDTVTGPTTLNTISAGGVPQSQTLESLYNFWGYGARIGHAALSRSMNRAPETYSYLDITIGPYSNLESFICHPGTATTTNSNSSCAEYGTDSNGALLFPVDSRKRLYRLDIEGLLKIPRTPLYVGFNANIGQRTLGAVHLDHGYAAPDDLRFLFGTKFDIAALLNKFNLGTN